MTTPLLSLTEVSEGVVNQATAHNTALRQMEARSFRVLSRVVTTPAVGASESHSYIIPAGATGVWASKTNQIASWIGGAWSYYTPVEGVGGIWVNDEDTAYSFDGSNWVASGGVGASAPFSDATALVKGSADSTKQLRIEVDGLTTATTRVLTAMDASGTIALVGDQAINPQTGTTYTYVDGDRGKLVTHSNAAAIAGTLPQAGAASSFLANWFMDVQNRGAGTLTITPTTSTIDGAATLAFTTGQGCRIVSDGTNYFTQRGGAGIAAGGGGTSITGTAGPTGGNATATGGASSTSSSVGGAVIITGGVPGTGGTGGGVDIAGAPGGTDGTSTAGGPITINGGVGKSTSGLSGAVTIRNGLGGGGTGTAAELVISGQTNSGGGGVKLSCGNPASGASAAGVEISTPAANNGSGAPVAVTAGAASGGSNAGGNITITAGLGGAVSGAGGQISLIAGNGGGNSDTFGGPGGQVVITAGRSRASDVGAAVVITAGIGGNAATGGKAQLVGGAAGGGNNNGGNVALKPGAGAGTGAAGNVVLNDSGAALATTATGGFTCFPTCAGAPTGVPASIPTGTVPMVFDTANLKLYAYTGGVWRSTAAFT